MYRWRDGPDLASWSAALQLAGVCTRLCKDCRRFTCVWMFIMEVILHSNRLGNTIHYKIDVLDVENVKCPSWSGNQRINGGACADYAIPWPAKLLKSEVGKMWRRWPWGLANCTGRQMARCFLTPKFGSQVRQACQFPLLAALLRPIPLEKDCRMALHHMSWAPPGGACEFSKWLPPGVHRLNLLWVVMQSPNSIVKMHVYHELASYLLCSQAALFSLK